MRVGVIGGSGFIGSHVLDLLVEEGHEVTVFDIMEPHHSAVRHIVVDILDFHQLVIALAGQYDAVFLLAAVSNVDHVYQNPLETSLVNIQGVANVLEGVRRFGGRLILSSTVWVYNLANPTEPILTEDTPLLVQNVNHPYTASKVAAELWLKGYHALYGTDFTVLRYGIPYGPRGREGTVITNFIQRALRGEPLTIHGDGSQTRNFIYVEDLAAGNVAALLDEARNQIYNLDGPRRVSIREVAETVSEAIEGTVIEYLPGRPGDHVVDRPISVEKAKRDLGWEPTTDLKEGVARYVEWYRKRSPKGLARTSAPPASKRQSSKGDGASASPTSP